MLVATPDKAVPAGSCERNLQRWVSSKIATDYKPVGVAVPADKSLCQTVEQHLSGALLGIGVFGDKGELGAGQRPVGIGSAARHLQARSEARSCCPFCRAFAASRFSHRFRTIEKAHELSRKNPDKCDKEMIPPRSSYARFIRVSCGS